MGGGSGRKPPLGSAPTPVAAAQQAEGMMIDGAAWRLGRRRERVEEGTTELSPYTGWVGPREQPSPGLLASLNGLLW